MTYINEQIAKVVKCDFKTVEYIDSGEEVEVFSFIDNNKSKKIIKIYSKVISFKKGFDKVKKDSIEKTNILRGTSKILKPLFDGEIKLYDNKYYFQIFNYMDVDLLSICNDRKKIVNLYEFFIIALRIVMGVDSLHKANIVHCDIKIENILVNLKDKKVKLIDFGFVKKVKKNSYYTPQGTLVYAAPELKKFYTVVPGDMLFPTDIYSLGIVLYAMFTKNINLSNFYYYKENPEIAPLPYENAEIRESFFELIKRMTSENPETRPNIEEVKNIMVQIYLNIENERKKKGIIENTKLKSREKLELGILNDLDFKEEEVNKVELNTLKRIKFLIEDNKMTPNLKHNIKKYINDIYFDNVFNIEENNFKELSFEESIDFKLMQTRLNNTKLAQNEYCSIRKIDVENNKKFLNFLAKTINSFDNLKEKNQKDFA